MNKTLITGKSGTIGSNLNNIDSIGYSSLAFDLRNQDEAFELVRYTCPDNIIHLAAKVGGLGEHLKQKSSLFIDNMKINLNVLEAAKYYKVPRVLSLLSSCVFSPSSSQPYNEHHLHDAEPFEAHTGYGHAKRMLELHSRLYYEEYKLKYNCIIPTNVYGPYDDFNLEKGHVVSVLIHKCYLAKLQNENFIVWGNGKQERDFLFAKDLSKIIEWALDSYLEKEPLIISNSTPISIAEIAETIAKHLKFKGKIIFDASKPTGQIRRTLSGDKFASIKSDFKFTILDDGIAQTVDWFVNNYYTARK